MHFPLLLAATGFSLTGPIAGNPVPTNAEVNTVSDGTYYVKAFTNGTTTYTAVSDDADPIIVHRAAHSLEAREPELDKRRTDCWGTQLDTLYVDVAAQGLREWAGSGTTLTSPFDATQWVASIVGDVSVYYCIIRAGAAGNLDVNDVNYALGQMDAKCRPYEASWFQWYVLPP